MSRLIDADALKEEIVKRTPHFTQRIAFTPCFDAIRNAPTVDAVPVVRCKYCANREYDNYCRVVGRWVYDKEFFCAGGKRKRRASIPLPDPIPTDLT